MGTVKDGPSWPAAECVEQAVEMWRSGLSAGAIAKKIGVNHGAIAGMLHRRGLKRGSSRQSNDATFSRPRAAAASFQKPKAAKPAQKWNARIPPSAKATDEAVPAPIVVDLHIVGMPFGRLPVNGCRYPLGGLFDAADLFCGCAQTPGSPYCEVHSAVCYPTKGRGKR